MIIFIEEIHFKMKCRLRNVEMSFTENRQLLWCQLLQWRKSCHYYNSRFSKPGVIAILTLPSLAVPSVSCGATNDNKVGILVIFSVLTWLGKMKRFNFRCFCGRHWRQLLIGRQQRRRWVTTSPWHMWRHGWAIMLVAKCFRLRAIIADQFYRWARMSNCPSRQTIRSGRQAMICD